MSKVTISGIPNSLKHFEIFIVKSKAIPLQAWRGPEGFRNLRLPDFKTVGT